ncbi:hypothetical protein RVS70_05220 [Virgibacillus sp. M23]|nr:hypothetical protein [Virgibacillus sp. M23]MDY7043601.1 hypothetical protein [Virgibacillus sp. M23]
MSKKKPKDDDSKYPVFKCPSCGNEVILKKHVNKCVCNARIKVLH